VADAASIGSEETVDCSSTCALAPRDHAATEAAAVAARYVRLRVWMEVRMRRAYRGGRFCLKNPPAEVERWANYTRRAIEEAKAAALPS
jgi:hypothetical protein